MADAPPADRSDDPLVVFVHIRKTAGKTLRQILYHQYRRQNTRLVRNFFTDAERSYESAAELAKSPRGLSVVHGHMLFWPELGWPADTRFVTILRDPVERTLSHYYWLRARSSRFTKTLDESLADGTIVDNLQTRVLSAQMPPYMELGRDALDKAIEQLDRFAVVGVTEQFDKSVALMTEKLGWRWRIYHRENVTPGRKRRDELPPATIARIEELHQLDVELYRRAAERLDADLAREGDRFAVDLEAFERAVARASQIGDGAPLDASIVAEDNGMRAHLVAARAEVMLREAEIQRLRIARKPSQQGERTGASKAGAPKREAADSPARVERALGGARKRLAAIEARIGALEQEGLPSPAAITTLQRKADTARKRIAELERRQTFVAQRSGRPPRKARQKSV